ncbi:MAG: hypothetical protein M3011_02200 [Actinomycetota bacterium]|nr:hypothetical protein [Actinomycetota bacterium]
MTKPENEIVVVGSGGVEEASWTLPVRTPPDLSVVEELARLALAARRLGYSIELRNACGGVSELVDLAGLRVEVVRKAEGGEQGRVEKVVMPDDPVA